MVSLVKGCKSFQVLESDAEAPEGCSLYAFDDTKLFLLVKGIVDIAEEVKKLQKKQEKLNNLQAVLIKQRSADGYALNVKEEIKTMDTNKVNGYQSEIDAIAAAIENFLKLM